MGGVNSITDARYTVEVPDSAKPGNTGIFRNPEGNFDAQITSGGVTLHESFANSAATHGSSNASGQRRVLEDGKLGEYVWSTYSQLRETSRKVGFGLEKLGLHHREVEGRSFVGIYSKNRHEWLVADLALMSQGITSVPMYDTQQADTIDMIVDQTQMKGIFCPEYLAKNLIKLKGQGLVKSLHYVLTSDNASEELRTAAKEQGLEVHSLAELENLHPEGQEHPPTPDDWFTICYTSGTTGKSKGAIISHRNMVSTIAGVSRTHLKILSTDTYISYLPLAHMFDRLMVHMVLSEGAAVGFFAGDVTKLRDDLTALKPTVFISVPRLFNRFYDTINQMFSAAKGPRAEIIKKCIELKDNHFNKTGSTTHHFADNMVFGKLKFILGGRVRIMVTGSAPIAAEVLKLLRIAFSASFLEGYGQTETCAGSVLTHSYENYAGIIGGPVPTIELKLNDVPDMNYLSTDVDDQGRPTPRGEICFRGPTVFQGYFKLPEQTAETIDEEGWLHTGDVGVILPYKGALKIIDRKKNFFKLAQGEYVAAEKIEIAYTKSYFISQIFVYGDSFQYYLVGIVVPDEAFIRQHWAPQVGIANETSFKDICADPRLKEKIYEEMTRLGKEEKLHGFEIVKKIHLEPVAWTPDDLLTPTQKLMRHQAKIKYEEVLKDLYSQPL
jgi:long-chain acyl-CoA synthetase